jgi:hypothetical protein
MSIMDLPFAEIYEKFWFGYSKMKTFVLSVVQIGLVASSIASPTEPTVTTDPPPSTTNAPAYTVAVTANLDNYWNIYIGPISTADITTTVSATPIPSSELVPPPFLQFDATVPLE